MPRRIKRLLNADAVERDFYQKVGARLRIVRELVMDRQADVARHFGVDQSTWNKWEAGTRGVSYRIIDQFCATFDCPHEYLTRGLTRNMRDDLRLRVSIREAELAQDEEDAEDVEAENLLLERVRSSRASPQGAAALLVD